MQRILSNISQVVGPSPAEIAALQHILRPRSLVKGEHFLQEGEICRSIAFVEKGSFRVYYAVDGKDIHKDFLFENGIIGSFASFFSQSPSALYITALEDSHILELTYQEVMHLYECYRQKLGRIIAQDQFVRAETREASLLKDTPLVRYQALLEAHPKVFRRVPLQYIASYLGITPETLSRYRSKTNA